MTGVMARRDAVLRVVEPSRPRPRPHPRLPAELVSTDLFSPGFLSVAASKIKHMFDVGLAAGTGSLDPDLDPAPNSPNSPDAPTPIDSCLDSGVDSGVDSCLDSGVDSGVDPGLTADLTEDLT